MGKYMTLFGAIISMLIGIWGLIGWWWDFKALLRGAVPPILILGGLAALFAAISEIKDSAKAKKEDKK